MFSFLLVLPFVLSVVYILPNLLIGQHPAASIGLYVDCGSIYETPEQFGVTHLLERMAFKSTRNRSNLRVVREVEAIGGNVTTSALREQMGYTYYNLKTYVPQMVELLIDCVRNPVFLDWEINEQVPSCCAFFMSFLDYSCRLVLTNVIFNSF